MTRESYEKITGILRGHPRRIRLVCLFRTLFPNISHFYNRNKDKYYEYHKIRPS